MLRRFGSIRNFCVNFCQDFCFPSVGEDSATPDPLPGGSFNAQAFDDSFDIS